MDLTSTAPLSVGDLFCGAGGFAEGFAQAGFRIAWGVDVWSPAARTFGRNFPGARSIEADVLSLDPRELSPVDVLIGSPPCVHFSAANRGGGGDREAGMELVSRFLEFVRALSPHYWVMENVRGLRTDLEARMQGEEFREPDRALRLPIPIREVLDSADYGAPQNRLRLFSGDFPLPEHTAKDDRSSAHTLRDVLEGLPNPIRGVAESPARIPDPLYPGVSIARSRLRDHFEDPRWFLTVDEVESSRERRVRDRIYGVMPFPDDIDRPARTITATKTRGSRATLVIPCPDRKDVPFRTLTARECASVQGFPLSYQFWGKSMSSNDALIGNAVVPQVARAIADSILIREGRELPEQPILRHLEELPPLLPYRRSVPKKFSMSRRFRGSVDLDWRRDHRIELDNDPWTREHGRETSTVSLSWRVRVYLGYATHYKCYDVPLRTALALGRALVANEETGVSNAALSDLSLATVRYAMNGFPTGVELQEEWCGLARRYHGPRKVLAWVTREVGRTFPASIWAGRTLPVSITEPYLEKSIVARGKEAGPGQPLAMSVRLAASAITLSILCAKLNEGEGALRNILVGLTSPRGLQSRRLDAWLKVPSRARGTQSILIVNR
jgi:DNA (cytosine-5)-methyltransferase 1